MPSQTPAFVRQIAQAVAAAAAAGQVPPDSQVEIQLDPGEGIVRVATWGAGRLVGAWRVPRV